MNDLESTAGEFIKALKEIGFRGSLRQNVPISKMAWYRVGGPALVFAEPETEEDLFTFRTVQMDYPLRCELIGGGSNLLVSDDGYRGILVRLAGDFSNLTVNHEEKTISCGSAVPLAKVIREGTGIGMGGVERLAGIPGWVGGAIYMNAGTYREHMDGLLSEINVLTHNLEYTSLKPEECGFDYRSSIFQKSGDIILNCTILGTPTEPGDISAEIEKRLKRRRETQPVDEASCGCVFRNPGREKAAARLIQDLGLKGVRSGDAVISDVHANFIINDGSARARDIISLMALARNRVREEFGIELVPEVQALGFDKTLVEILDEWTENS